MDISYDMIELPAFRKLLLFVAERFSLLCEWFCKVDPMGGNWDCFCSMYFIIRTNSSWVI